MNYLEFDKCNKLFDSTYTYEACLHAYTVAKQYRDKYKLSNDIVEVLYELLANWWHEDDGIGYDKLVRAWINMLKKGKGRDDCYVERWEIIKGYENE